MLHICTNAVQQSIWKSILKFNKCNCKLVSLFSAEFHQQHNHSYVWCHLSAQLWGKLHGTSTGIDDVVSRQVVRLPVMSTIRCLQPILLLLLLSTRPSAALLYLWSHLKYDSFCFAITACSKKARLVYSRTDWFDLLAVSWILSILVQHISKLSVRFLFLWRSTTRIHALLLGNTRLRDTFLHCYCYILILWQKSTPSPSLRPQSGEGQLLWQGGSTHRKILAYIFQDCNCCPAKSQSSSDFSTVITRTVNYLL